MWGVGRTQSGKVQTGVDFFLFLNAMPSSRPMGKPLSWRVASMGGEGRGWEVTGRGSIIVAGTDRGMQGAPAEALLEPSNCFFSQHSSGL